IILGLLNSKVIQQYLNILNPTLSVQNGDIDNLPYFNLENADDKLLSEISGAVRENVEIAKRDWDNFETSWEFKRHPLFNYSYFEIARNFKKWESDTDIDFQKMKANEEGLNQIFINIYSLENELTPEVCEKDIVIRKADLERDIKSFISYAIGCS